MKTVADLVVRIANVPTDTDDVLKKIERDLDRRLESLGRRLEDIGRKLTTGISAPITEVRRPRHAQECEQALDRRRRKRGDTTSQR